MTTENTVSQVIKYYDTSAGYQEVLDGACHFGYTGEDESFDFQTAQFEMTRLLGKSLNLPAGSIVLDAGCGFGSVSVPLVREFGLEVVGVDLNTKRIEGARAHSKDNETTAGTFFVPASYDAIPLESNSLDGVITMETLVHADPLEQVLSEFMRVLKPGGRLVLFEYSIPKMDSFDPVSRRIARKMIERTGMASIEKFTHGAFPDILKKAGFKDISVEDISGNVWPTWRWLFDMGVKRVVPSIISGNIFENTNLLASLMIWPTRKKLGYNVVTASKSQS